VTAREQALEAALRVVRDCPYCGVEVDAALGAA
jgi:ElaB/YqjD/DUF883 family membrane-anchored ribosome-binding protein